MPGHDFMKLLLLVFLLFNKNKNTVLIFMQELNTSVTSLREVSRYYFDGNGKYIRPMIVLLAAGACNKHTRNERFVFILFFHYAEPFKAVNYFKVLIT